MHRQKRAWLVATLLVTLSMIASACDTGTPATPTTVAPTSTTQAADQPTAMAGEPTTTAGAMQGAMTGKIDFQVFGDPAELAAFQSVVAGFKLAQPNAEVNVIHVPAQGDHMTKLSTAFSAGNPPDVFIVNYRRYGQFASKGVIEAAGPLMAESDTISEDLYFPEALNAFKYKGVLQCIPQNVSNLVVYYNKDLFTQAGLSAPKANWTWDDFLATAKALTKDTNGDGTIDVYGLGVEPQIIRVAPFVWSNGAEIVDNPAAPTSFALSSGPAREAVQFFMDLSLIHKVVPTEPEAKSEDNEARFMNGRLGMVLQSRAATPTFREIEGFEWDVAPLPMKAQPASILHSDAYCIAKATKNKDLAWAFVEYAQGVDGQERAAKLGRTVPSLKSVAQSDVFLKSSEPPASNQVFLDAVPVMKLIPVLSTWPEIEGIANEELERAFYGLVPVDQAIQKITDDTKTLFAEGVADRDK
jgi:multiple sugar transport system substrate-binding protein